jgi:hypothetical protein
MASFLLHFSSRLVVYQPSPSLLVLQVLQVCCSGFLLTWSLSSTLRFQVCCTVSLLTLTLSSCPLVSPSLLFRFINHLVFVLRTSPPGLLFRLSTHPGLRALALRFQVSCTTSLLTLTLSSCPPGTPGLLFRLSTQPGVCPPALHLQVSCSSSLLSLASVLLHFTSRLVVQALNSPWSLSFTLYLQVCCSGCLLTWSLSSILHLPVCCSGSLLTLVFVLHTLPPG